MSISNSRSNQQISYLHQIKYQRDIELKSIIEQDFMAFFHSISDISNFKDEEEILFSIGNVFRVEEIHWCEKKSLWEIKLILQKHILYRSQFGTKSINNMKWKFVESAWESLLKLSDKLFKSFVSQPFLKSVIR
jgi:hypothetical protein